jgi:hypothetical protein
MEDYFNKHRPNFKPKGSFGRAWKAYAIKLEKRILALQNKLASDGDLADVSKCNHIRGGIVIVDEKAFCECKLCGVRY